MKKKEGLASMCVAETDTDRHFSFTWDGQPLLQLGSAMELGLRLMH